MKVRMKFGLRIAHRTYQGSATMQNMAIASGCAVRKATRHCFVASAQRPMAPAARIIAAGPFASTASPRKAPNKAIDRRLALRARPCLSPAPYSAPEDRRACAPFAIAKVSEALNSMSGVAARENPMAAMLVEKMSGASKLGLEREATFAS